jgi:hypothetical protein
MEYRKRGLSVCINAIAPGAMKTTAEMGNPVF